MTTPTGRTVSGASLAVGALILLSVAACAMSEKGARAPTTETGPPSSAVSGPPDTGHDAQVNSCSAPPSSPRGSCAGCSVNCGDKEAICVPGEEWPSGGNSCQKTATCACH